MGMKEDEAIEDRMVTKQIENAQRKVEAHNFDIRKNLLEYDDVANDQRKVIYEQRNELLEAESTCQETIDAIRERRVRPSIARRYVPENSIDEQWDLAGLERALASRISASMSASTSCWPSKDHEIDDAELTPARAGRGVERHFARARKPRSARTSCASSRST